MSSSSSTSNDLQVGWTVRGLLGKRKGVIGKITLVDADPRSRRCCIQWANSTASSFAVRPHEYEVIARDTSTSSSSFVATGARKKRAPSRYAGNKTPSPPSSPSPSSSDNDSLGTQTPESSDVEEPDEVGESSSSSDDDEPTPSPPSTAPTTTTSSSILVNTTPPQQDVLSLQSVLLPSPSSTSSTSSSSSAVVPISAIVISQAAAVASSAAAVAPLPPPPPSSSSSSSSSLNPIPSGPLTCHGVTWSYAPDDGITEDYRVSSQKKSFSLNWPGGTTGGSQPLDFFYLLFPYSVIASSLTATHRNYDAANVLQRDRCSSDTEVFQMLGVILLMSTLPLNNYADYWNVDPKDQKKIEKEVGYNINIVRVMQSPPAFGSRLGISRAKFEKFVQHYQWGDWNNEEMKVTKDEWLPIRALVSSFNDTRERNVHPGQYICVDECMSKWEGAEGKMRGKGHPGVIKMPAKPVSQGTEIKASACAESGVMLRLEPNEGKEWSDRLLREMQVTNPWLTYKSSACTMRLVQPWFSSARVVCGDSWFASVETAVALRKHGLHFTGLVKGNSRYFPKKHLDKYPFNARGDTVTLTASKDGIPLIAHAWSDRKIKCFISTCGTTLPGTPVYKKRYSKKPFPSRHANTGEEIRYRVVKRTKMVEQYFECADAVDIHNHYRQGSLALEDFGTKLWWWRASNTVLGMVVADCFLSYRACFPRTDLSFSSFILVLANQLIFPRNELHRSLSSTSSNSSSSSSLSARYGDLHDIMTTHVLHPLSSHPFYKKKTQQTSRSGAYNRNCIVCKKPCYYYCASETCTIQSADTASITAVCGPTQPCFQTHLSNVINS
jgi:hypothetical protein